MTRKDYMNKKVTFTEYYESVGATAGITFKHNQAFLVEVKRALDAGDEHLNTIALRRWDMLAAGAQAAISRALKAHEDFYSMAGGVCTMKAIARKEALNLNA